MPVVGAQTAWATCTATTALPYCVGAAKLAITPSAPVNLGGYGFGGPVSAGPVVISKGRVSTGVAHDIFARAMAISDGDQTVVFCAIDTQGHFLAYQMGPLGLTNGPYGFAAIRDRVASDRGIPRRNIIVASIHDHAGPDDTGIWGGLSNGYLQFIADQTVGAIEAALDNEQPATLAAASVDTAADNLLVNLLPPAYPIDTNLRTLVAKNAGGQTVATLVNFSAHPTVLGSDNTLISPDWPGAAIDALEQASPGSTALVMVASVGRTQPNAPAAATEFASMQQYGNTIASLSLQSLTNSLRVAGPIDAVQRFIRIPVTNAGLAALNVVGIPGFDRAQRSILPPYLVGDVVGTVVGAVRIGDLLFAAVPAESYPETQKVLEARVTAQATSCSVWPKINSAMIRQPTR